MRFRKIYGESKTNTCLFCDKTATTKNSQNIPVCGAHTKSLLNDFKCICGEYLDLKEGKYGIFFTCINCGIINMRKALENNQIEDVSKNDDDSFKKFNNSKTVFINQRNRRENINELIFKVEEYQNKSAKNKSDLKENNKNKKENVEEDEEKIISIFDL